MFQCLVFGDVIRCIHKSCDSIVILCLHCRSQTLALSAMTLHACQNQDEPKSRKYLARILWLLTYDDVKVCNTKNLTCCFMCSSAVPCACIVTIERAG